MWHMSRACYALSLLMFVSACKPSPLFELDEPVVVNDPGHGVLVARLNARIHPEVLTPGRQVKLRFDAPGLPMTLTLDPVPGRSLLLRGNQHAWVAKVPNGGNEAFFMLIDGWAEARVPANGRIYRLRSLSEDRGVLEIFAGNRFPPDQHQRVVQPGRERRWSRHRDRQHLPHPRGEHGPDEQLPAHRGHPGGCDRGYRRQRTERDRSSGGHTQGIGHDGSANQRIRRLDD